MNVENHKIPYTWHIVKIHISLQQITSRHVIFTIKHNTLVTFHIGTILKQISNKFTYDKLIQISHRIILATFTELVKSIYVFMPIIFSVGTFQ